MTSRPMSFGDRFKSIRIDKRRYNVHVAGAAADYRSSL